MVSYCAVLDIFPFYEKNGVMTKNTWFKTHRQDSEFPAHYLKPLTTLGRKISQMNYFHKCSIKYVDHKLKTNYQETLSVDKVAAKTVICSLIDSEKRLYFYSILGTVLVVFQILLELKLLFPTTTENS